jgi:hypothetical protein
MVVKDRFRREKWEWDRINEKVAVKVFAITVSWPKQERRELFRVCDDAE